LGIDYVDFKEALDIKASFVFLFFYGKVDSVGVKEVLDAFIVDFEHGHFHSEFLTFFSLVFDVIEDELTHSRDDSHLELIF
jgi:hypothetical protein